MGPLIAAALLTGFAITVKVHAVGLLAPVLVAFWLTRRADWTEQVATILRLAGETYGLSRD